MHKPRIVTRSHHAAMAAAYRLEFPEADAAQAAAWIVMSTSHPAARAMAARHGHFHSLH